MLNSSKNIKKTDFRESNKLKNCGRDLITRWKLPILFIAYFIYCQVNGEVDYLMRSLKYPIVELQLFDFHQLVLVPH